MKDKGCKQALSISCDQRRSDSHDRGRNRKWGRTWGEGALGVSEGKRHGAGEDHPGRYGVADAQRGHRITQEQRTHLCDGMGGDGIKVCFRAN